MAPPELLVPTDLLPRDGRFGCGPAKVRPEAIAAVAKQAEGLLGTSHRQAPIKALVERFQEGLRDLFTLPDDWEVVLGNGGATAFWDAACFCLIERRSLHYSFGEFSARFAASATAAPWLDDPVVVEAPAGQRPDLVDSDGSGGAGEVDVQALTHNETSTGVAMDLARPGGGALVVVDATSGAGALPVDPAEIDAYYFSLQKGFASEGGIYVALLSPEAVARIEHIAASDRYVPPFFDLRTALGHARKQETYNTPSITTLLLAAEQTEWMLERGGLEWAVSQCAAKAQHVYTWADESDYAIPFVRDAAARSNVVATIDLTGVSADDVNAVLRANGIVDTDSYRKLGRNQLRIGLFPAVDHEDVVAYTACVDWIVERLD